jgi:hypothetical protein
MSARRGRVAQTAATTSRSVASSRAGQHGVPGDRLAPRPAAEVARRDRHRAAAPEAFELAGVTDRPHQQGVTASLRAPVAVGGPVVIDAW